VTRKKLGKSAWNNKKGEVVNVESIALEHYSAEGYTGYALYSIDPPCCLTAETDFIQKRGF